MDSRNELMKTHSLFGILAYHETRDVDEENEGNSSLFAELDELRRFEG